VPAWKGVTGVPWADGGRLEELLEERRGDGGARHADTEQERTLQTTAGHQHQQNGKHDDGSQSLDRGMQQDAEYVRAPVEERVPTLKGIKRL